ncbi:protein KHNYN-like [Spea bombifrons]|uniref:protein KHNYN-like n=1 Tax=Spea bombifrons TaxID=233779 RepID=UPI0023491BD6|nr:protein KHNYN-like [Spea bombifrons]
MLMAVEEHEAGQENSCMDEFAVPQGGEKELRDQRPHVERLFGVNLNILGVLDETELPLEYARCQQMWLQLQGDRRSVQRAKDYIKGICTPEIIEDIGYPREMHCIFVGAKGLFLDCLTRATSACLKPLSPGRIRISGLAEAAVMAQSHVHAFADICKSNITPEDRETHIKRNFKDLVEEYSDNHELDLLILSTSVKEQLLALVQEDYKWSTNKKVTGNKFGQEYSGSRGDDDTANRPFFPAQLQTQEKPGKPAKHICQTNSRTNGRVLHQRASEPCHFPMENEVLEFSKHKTQPKRTDTRKRPVMEVTPVDFLHHFPNENPRSNENKVQFVLDDDNDDEFHQISGLLDTIMGREEGDRGSQAQFALDTQEEFNMLLDFFKTMGYQEAIVLKVLSENGIQEPSKILDKVKLEQSISCQVKTKPDSPPLNSNDRSHRHSDKNDDYLLEVMKSAATNCGYSPTEIVDIGDGSVAGLLRKLNEKNISEDGMASLNVQRSQKPKSSRGLEETPNTQSTTQSGMEMSDMIKTNKAFGNHPVEDLFPMGVQKDISDVDGTKKVAVEEDSSAPVVTGAQRFNEAMQNPFRLNLRNEKGNDQLRHIIIDGSNVAMIHGLRRFFSCRGIALATQYFWDRGHRNITIFVPQWRTKKDSKVKEQHFLTELSEIGLLSLTPSRTVDGKRITSYDDRFMLQLAEKTDGVIVTNDNLRDIYDESDAWKNIIKGRLLQFTFVGDIFMVPDDPLGRNGPPLDKFLCRTSRKKTKSKGHSFAGRRISHSPPKPSSQTEVLNFRERKPNVYRVEEETDVRTRKETERLRQELLHIFPSQDTKVDFVLQREPYLNDLNKLSELIVTLKF